MPSPILEATLLSTRTEADYRSLVLAKAKASDAYGALWGKSTAGMSDDERVDHELAVQAAERALNEAARAIYLAAAVKP